VGPGTGLGGAFLDWFAGIPRSFACEPGHMGLAPGNELELDIFRLLLPRHGNIYAELLVSGPGLARLYRALGEIRGEPAEPLEPAEISQRALAGRDALCELALATFCALLGSACGDFLLANGSYGGLYLAGGIVPRLSGFLDSSDFHSRLIAKGAMRETLTGVPVYVITSEYPGLIGAAHAPM
jgi:glucokinase